MMSYNFNRRRVLWVVLFVMITAFCLFPLLLLAQQVPAVTQSAPRATAAPPADEVRALWVVRTTLTSPEKIRRMVESAHANRFNTLIVQVRGRGDAYYDAQWEPRAATLKGSAAILRPARHNTGRSEAPRPQGACVD